MKPARARHARATRSACALLTALALAESATAADDPPAADYRVEVTEPRPALGHAVEAERVPAHVQEVGPEALEAHVLLPLQALLAEEIAGAWLADTQGSAFNSTLQLRGYAASPVLGVPQGLAVFQNGVRVNDPFGDVVHWALLPEFAVERLEVHPGAHPRFGLNAQGGAVLLQTKDGFSAPGARLVASGASHPAGDLTLEYGTAAGDTALYGGLRALQDGGWRDHSPGELQQGFLDLARRGERGRIQLSAGLAAADYTGNGAAPRELVDEDRRAVYTRPDRSQALAFDATLRGRRLLGDAALFEGLAYFRDTGFETLNGDEAEFEACTGIAAGPEQLCTRAGEPREAVLTDARGRPLSSALDITGAENETRTRSRATGFVAQLSGERALLGLEHRASAGLSVDLGFVDYRARSRAGALGPSRRVEDLGFYLGGDDFQTRLAVDTRSAGVFASDAVRLSEALTLTAALRAQLAVIDLDDRRGDELNGSHAFFRVNPFLALDWRIRPGLSAWLSYGEANRAPTAAELSCADPERACRVPNAFTADPPLDDVVTRTVEAGVRGAAGGALRVEGSLAAYAAWNQDDILFVASGPVIGSGYFTNAGDTRRIGVEAALDARWRSVHAFLRYGFLHATFESSLAVLSPHHPDADDEGRIQVSPGDRLPGLPQHTLVAGLRWAPVEAWTFGARVSAASGRRYVGDESNQLPSLPAYALLDLEARYRVHERVTLELRLTNVLDRDYATTGVLGEPDEVFPAFDDPRFLTPGTPRTLVGALHLRWP